MAIWLTFSRILKIFEFEIFKLFEKFFRDAFHNDTEDNIHNYFKSQALDQENYISLTKKFLGIMDPKQKSWLSWIIG